MAPDPRGAARGLRVCAVVVFCFVFLFFWRELLSCVTTIVTRRDSPGVTVNFTAEYFPSELFIYTTKGKRNQGF